MTFAGITIFRTTDGTDAHRSIRNKGTPKPNFFHLSQSEKSVVKNKYIRALQEMPQKQHNTSIQVGWPLRGQPSALNPKNHFVTFVGKTIFRTTDGTDAHRSIQAKELLSLALSI